MGNMTVNELIQKLSQFDGDLIVATVDDNALYDIESDPVIVVSHPTNPYQWEKPDGPISTVGLTERRLLL
jgi:hypothetical protein